MMKTTFLTHLDTNLSFSRDHMLLINHSEIHLQIQHVSYALIRDELLEVNKRHTVKIW